MCFDPLVLFIFCLSSYLCLDLHKFHYTNSIVFLLVYLVVFIPRFTESPVLHNSVLAVLLMKIIFPHKKILSLWIFQDWGVRENTKKESVQKNQQKKNDKYYKNSVQSWRYNWRNWTLILENLLKNNGACVWNEIKILNYLHINFQKQILKGQLSINQWKPRSLDHNNYFSGAVFDFEIKSSAIL